ncbi:MAG: group 1 truncated hemoglobin [Myxococcota bacterium]
MSSFEQVGGEWALRAIVHDFVGAMVEDPMIGFFFDDVDLHRLRDKEYEMTAKFLGAQIKYTGRGMRKAHRGRPIFAGQFDRRRQILVETLEQHHVPEEIRKVWLHHVDTLRPLILGAPGPLPILDDPSPE